MHELPIYTAVLLLGMLLGVALSVQVGPRIACLFDRWFIPTGLHQLTYPERAAVKQARAVPVPMHTHTNVRYKGVLHGYLHLPASECPCENNPFPPRSGAYQ